MMATFWHCAGMMMAPRQAAKATQVIDGCESVLGWRDLT
jgi:hypothetical protein